MNTYGWHFEILSWVFGNLHSIAFGTLKTSLKSLAIWWNILLALWIPTTGKLAKWLVHVLALWKLSRTSSVFGKMNVTPNEVLQQIKSNWLHLFIIDYSVLSSHNLSSFWSSAIPSSAVASTFCRSLLLLFCCSIFSYIYNNFSLKILHRFQMTTT